MTTDLPSDFWGGWIAVLTLVSLAGLGWLVYGAYFSKTDEEHHDETVWDGNLREGSNPAPMWWFWMIFGAMIFSVIYLMLYPGLGTFKGMLKWSQGGRVAESRLAYQAAFGGIRSTIADARLSTLRADPKFMASAKRVFDRNCAACHGYDAAGQALLFPNLVDNDWQWGSAPEQIEQTIRGGRNAVMVGWQQVLGDDGVKNVADYVEALGRGGVDGHAGEAQFKQYCAACHGPAGNGNTALGAPNLADDVWLYGGSAKKISATIALGRNGIMPAFETRLDDTQVRLLVAWLSQESATE